MHTGGLTSAATRRDEPRSTADGPDDPPSPTRRRRQNTGPQAPWRRHAANVLTGAVVIGAVWSLIAIPLHLILPRTVSAVDDFFEIISIPAGHTFFSAVYLGVIASALRQGKHIAVMWVFWLFAVPGILGSIGDLGWDLDFFPGKPQQFQATHQVVSHAVLNAGYLLVAILIAVLVWEVRHCFPARLARGSRGRAVLVLVVGLVLSCSVSLALTELFPGRLHGQREKAFWAIAASLGRSRSLGYSAHAGHDWIALLVGGISATTLIVALMLFLRSVRKDQLLTQADELQVRRLLLLHGERDSLGYFATRRDKAVIWAPKRDAAIAYRVVAGVSLASGDPIGAVDAWPQAVRAWLEEARRHGWAPAAISVSELGARTYVDHGLRALSMGDEAVIDTADFTLEGRTMRPVRQAVTRVQRAGYRATVSRHADVPATQLVQVIDKAREWRGAQSERGFSMALGRLGDGTDDRCVLVLAQDAAGELQGLLSLVPWGRKGVSLDVMRRHPASVNGLMEFMVVALVDACRDLGVAHISLNFAMFREVFSEAAKVGAGPVLKSTNAVLTLASKFWQLQSLYQSNAKYLPRWMPRLICYGRNSSLTQVMIAGAVAEGFLPGPRPVRRSRRSASGDSAASVDAGFTAQVSDQEAELLKPQLPERRRTDQERVRRAKLDELCAAGIDPYPVVVARTHAVREIALRHAGLPAGTHTGELVAVAGRVMALRDHGSLCFARLREVDDELQVMLDVSHTGPTALGHWRRLVDIGDHVSVSGEVVASRHGEVSVLADRWSMAAKCLHPLPGQRVRFADPELRARRRHLDLLVNAESRHLLHVRTQAVRALREGLVRRGFCEVETPMLQAVHGGANARPFLTHSNAYETDLSLRIAPELFLKRMSVAGMGKIFELNRNFRNEGADASHNPEFTSVEAYQPYADYHVMRTLTRELVVEVATAVFGRPILQLPRREGSAREVDISGPWDVIAVHAAVSAATGTPLDSHSEAEPLRELCRRHGVHVAESSSAGQLVLKLYDALVEPRTEQPTFYTDFPLDTSPLTRAHRDDPTLAERWDLVAFGTEIGTAYSELVDPVEQRRRLTEQSLAAAAGDPEAMSLDEDFLTALEYAMPPTGGLGIGVDRLVMMLTGQSIRRVVPFPFVRPISRDV